jgi:hypothetical protein
MILLETLASGGQQRQEWGFMILLGTLEQPPSGLPTNGNLN